MSTACRNECVLDVAFPSTTHPSDWVEAKSQANLFTDRRFLRFQQLSFQKILSELVPTNACCWCEGILALSAWVLRLSFSIRGRRSCRTADIVHFTANGLDLLDFNFLGNQGFSTTFNKLHFCRGLNSNQVQVDLFDQRENAPHDL